MCGGGGGGREVLLFLSDFYFHFYALFFLALEVIEYRLELTSLSPPFVSFHFLSLSHFLSHLTATYSRFLTTCLSKT